uniref:Uncharacterized protein n=1 Tax=Noctiluca scintillans TaxID=2966 RepID=A0A7S1FBD3_NOCSC|mmetsp:Transcript_50370/g.133774  ORF Transcript_50370/g.133774 Transcript_50370/m.133774 type:complete len:194 (+) Transcript_50370:89-670(+)
MLKHKVVVLGDENCGKTSIIRRYLYDTYEESVQSTIGMDFTSKTVHLESGSAKIQLWDTAGQERFRSLIPSYIRDAAAACVVYDVTNRRSFESCRKWIEDVREVRAQDAFVVLVANKVDLATRNVQAEEGRQLAKELGLVFHETSAKTGQNITETFQKIAEQLPSGAPARGRESKSSHITLQPEKEKKKKSCC